MVLVVEKEARPTWRGCCFKCLEAEEISTRSATDDRQILFTNHNATDNAFKALQRFLPKLAKQQKTMAAVKGACLNHVARESTDIKRLARFYTEIFGFEQVESPKFDFEVIWLKLGSSFNLHLIERNPDSKLPEGPWSATSSALADPKNLPRGHHVCFYVPNFDSFVQGLKEKGIKIHERTQPDGKTKQAFFFDPDGNGLEASSQIPEL